MQRWIVATLAAFALFVTCAQAQNAARNPPKDVQPGVLAVSATPPIVAMNGKPDRLSPGARIHDLSNRLVLSGTLAGQTVYTVYRRDPSGLLHEMWLLTPDEYAKLGGAEVASGDGVRSLLEVLKLIWQARVLAGLL